MTKGYYETLQCKTVKATSRRTLVAPENDLSWKTFEHFPIKSNLFNSLITLFAAKIRFIIQWLIKLLYIFQS